MADVSKMVADRMAVSRTVLSSLEVHGPEVSAELTKVLFPKGPPKQLTIEAFLKALHDALARAVTELSEADMAHAQELADDAEPRATRDAGVAQLREKVMKLRSTLSAVYGAGILKTYGLVGETPNEPELLINVAKNTASLLTSRPITEKAQQEGVTVDPKALAAGLTAAVKKLQKALDDVRREEREGQLTRKKRDEAAAVWSGRYQGVADIATGIYEVCGRAELADVVRPTARRRAGLTEEEDVNPDASGEPSAGASPE